MVAVRPLLLGHKLHDGGALLGVVEGGDVAARLVEHVIALLLGAVQELAVDADVIFGGVVASA